MSKMLKFMLVLMLGAGMWSIGSFIFGGTVRTTEKIHGQTERELLDFAQSVCRNVKTGKIRDFASQVFDLKHPGLKESYNYLRQVAAADKPDWSVEKHPGEEGYYVTFKTPGGTRAFILADRKNGQWKLIYAGQ